ncbi:MAG TPA: energy transducer TonB [Opitutaceae bacterium]|nr:energy transducer TonB [Opitutaceae bacterium]
MPRSLKLAPAGFGRTGWLLLGCLAAGGCTGLNPSEHPVSQMVPPLKLGVYTVATVDRKPVVTKEVQAEYPTQLYGYLEGKATVVFTVGVDGKAKDAMVVEADDGLFGEAALAALSKWRFRPAVLSARPVPCRMTLPFYFDSPYGYDHNGLSAGAPSDQAPSDAPASGSITPR